MPKLSPQEAIKQKVDRIEKSVRLEKTDRPPLFLLLSNSGFQARHAGYTMAEITYDYDKFNRSLVKFAQDFDLDWTFANAAIGNFINHIMIDDHPDIAAFLNFLTGPIHDILQDNYTRWPGRELEDNDPPQFVGGKFLEIDEYQLLIDDPKACINEVIFPRAYRALSEPGSGGSHGALIKLGMEVARLGGSMIAQGMQLREIGYPQAVMGMCYNPYDTIADYVRHFDNTITDFHRVPEKIKQAVEALLPFALKFVEVTTAVPPEMKDAYDFTNPFVFYPLHLNEFLSPRLYNRYYWPPLKELVEADIAAGRIPWIFFEGDQTPHLETLLELPRGKIIAHFERPDWNKVAETVGGHQCVMGGLPPSLLISGTPAEVKDHVRKMVDLFKDGGLILANAQGSLPREVKEENLDAVVEAVKEMG